MTQRRHTVLVVDDSPEDRELYRRYLQRDRDCTYTILEAASGQQGLALWEQHAPDVVLLDYRLPDLDGLELLSQLHSPCEQPCLPAIVVTGQGNEAIAVQAIKSGAQDYLIKGQITPESLHLAVNSTIEAVQLRMQLQQRIERERIVAHIARQIHESLDLDHILQTTATEVRQFLHTDRVVVFRLEADGNGTVVAESVGAEWRSLLSTTIHDPCLAANYLRFSRPGSISHDAAFVEDYVRRYRQGQVTVIPDIYNSDIDPCHVELLAQFQVRANLVVPVLHDDRFWGLLITHHCTAPREWQPLEIDLLNELATHMGIALRQAELYQQSQAELAERQQVEIELRESEGKLRSTLKASRMGTWDWNIQTGHIQWSDNLEAMFGLEAGTFDGSFTMFADRLHPDDRDRVLATVNQAITTGEDYSIEFRVVYPNGQIRWALSQGKVFYNQDRQPVRMAGNDIDITERKRAERALQESEVRFRQLAENINAVFWIKEVLEDRISYVSPAYEHLWGLNPQELYENQQAWVHYIHPDDQEWTGQAFEQNAAAGLFDVEYRIILPDGRVRWVHDRCFPLHDDAGRLYRFAGIAEDVTDRKQIEAMLRLQAQVLDQTHDSVITTDLDGYITSWNNGAQKLFGYTAEAALGQHVSLLYPPDTHTLLETEIIAPLKATGQHEVEVVAQHQSGDHIDLLLSLSLLRDADQTPVGMVGFSMDITDRKRAERALRESEERLQLALEGSGSCPWDWNITTNEDYFSPGWLNILGYQEGELPGTYSTWEQLIHPDDRDWVVERLQAHFQDDSVPYKFEYRMRTKSGEWKWIANYGKVVSRDAQGNPLRMAGIHHDISDRRQVEIALHESRERFRTSIENMLDCFAIYTAVRNEQGQIIDFQAEYVNDAACLMSQIPREQHLSRRLCELLPEHRKIGLFDEYCQVVETGQSLVKDSLIYEGEFGQQRLTKALDIRVAKFGDGYIATWRDITDRKRTEEALRQNEELLRLALASAQAGSWDWELATNKVVWSPENFQLYGLDPAQPSMQYADWYNALHPDDRERAQAEITRVIEEKRAEYQAEFRINHPQRGTRWVLALGRLTLSEQGNPTRLSGINLDITDRKQSELRIRESEAQLKLAYKATQSGLWDWDLTHNTARVSEEYCTLLGFDPTMQAVSFEDWLSRVHPDDRGITATAVQTALQQQQEYYAADYRIVRPDGVRWIAARGQAFYDPAGNAVRLLGNVQDITDRKQAEEALRQSEEFKRRILDSSSDCIKLLDLHGRLLYINVGGICLLEIDDVSLYLQGNWIDFWQPDDREAAETAIVTARTGETGRFQGFCPTTKGTPKWWDVAVTPILDTNGQVMQLLATSRDITERRQSEEALRESEERFRTLADNMSQFAWMADANGSIVWYNKRWFEYTGTTLEAMQGWGWQTVHHPDHVDRVVRHIRHCFETGERWEDTFPLRGRDGNYRWFLSRATPIHDSHGNVLRWFGTNTDITERQQAEQERNHLLAQEQAARAEAERANRIKDDFLAVLSHELRSPLNPILGWTKLLQTRTFDQSRTAEALATIERNARLQTQLIDDLLDVAKILRGKLITDTAPVDLVFVIESAIDTVQTAATSKSIRLHPVLPQIGYVSGDATRLQQIVWNLLSNAIKFTPPNGRVDILLKRVDHWAQITVSDTGKGINAEFLPHLFESFRQEDASTTRNYGGLGLGLAIVRSLVEAHGGTIAADSPGEGQGASFTVRLPLIDTTPAIKQPNSYPMQHLNLAGIRVLAVDDEADARDLLTVLLTQYGAEVLTVASAAEVLTVLESFQPDVLVSDIGMPRVDGYTLMRQIRALPPEKGGQTPAIALTAYAREEDRKRAIASGYQQQVTKPLDPDRLVYALISLMQNRAQG